MNFDSEIPYGADESVAGLKSDIQLKNGFDSEYCQNNKLNHKNRRETNKSHKSGGTD